MTHGPNATYHCTVCGASWSYEAVRHLACCRDCGSGLVRTWPTLDRGGAVGEGEAGRRQRQLDAPAELGDAAGSADRASLPRRWSQEDPVVTG